MGLSVDYELRLFLIALIEQHFDNQNGNVLVNEMLSHLKDENEHFQNDSNAMFWCHKFDELFLEFIKMGKMCILDAMSLRACRRLRNVSIAEEFETNSDKI